MIISLVSEKCYLKSFNIFSSFYFRSMSSKRKSPPTKFTPDDLNNGMHRTTTDLHEKEHTNPFTTSPIPEVEENALNLQQDSCDDSDERQQTYYDEEEEEEEEHFLDNMSSPVASDSCSPYPSRLPDPDSDSVVSDAEGRLEGGTSHVNPSGTVPAFYHRKQRLLQSVSSGKSHQPGETDSDSDPGCYSGSECGGPISAVDQRLTSPGQSTSGDAGGRPANRRSMDDVLKKLTSKMHSSASLSDNSSYGHCPSRKQANG